MFHFNKVLFYIYEFSVIFLPEPKSFIASGHPEYENTQLSN